MCQKRFPISSPVRSFCAGLLFAGAALSGCDFYDALEGNVAAPYQGYYVEVDTVLVEGCEAAGVVLVAVGRARQLSDPDRVDQTQLRLEIPFDPVSGDTLLVDVRAYVRGIEPEPPSPMGIPVVAQRLVTSSVLPPDEYVLTYFNAREGSVFQPTFVGCPS